MPLAFIGFCATFSFSSSKSTNPTAYNTFVFVDLSIAALFVVPRQLNRGDYVAQCLLHLIRLQIRCRVKRCYANFPLVFREISAKLEWSDFDNLPPSTSPS
jgi:hypothetical protein